MSKHTPTPWHVVYADTQCRIVDADCNPVTEINWGFGCGTATRAEENAACIVRAVNCHAELVEACQWALRCLRDECINPDCGMPERASATCEAALEATLAKAAGEKP